MSQTNEQPKQDLTTPEDIRLLVDTFYARASRDELLSPIFVHAFSGKENPLEPLYRYWETVLLEKKSYPDVPFPKHAKLPLTHQHFDRWLSIFHGTVEELFAGPHANDAKIRAIRMSEVFRYKLQLINF